MKTLTIDASNAAIYMKSDSIVVSPGNTVTSALSEIQKQVDILYEQDKRNKSFAWRHAKKRKRRYW